MLQSSPNPDNSLQGTVSDGSSSTSSYQGTASDSSSNGPGDGSSGTSSDQGTASEGSSDTATPTPPAPGAGTLREPLPAD